VKLLYWIFLGLTIAAIAQDRDMHAMFFIVMAQFSAVHSDLSDIRDRIYTPTEEPVR
jgi:hypothetical protein